MGCSELLPAWFSFVHAEQHVSHKLPEFTSDFSPPWGGGVGLGKGVETTQILRGPPGEGMARRCGAKTKEEGYLVRMGKKQ